MAWRFGEHRALVTLPEAAPMAGKALGEERGLFLQSPAVPKPAWPQKPPVTSKYPLGPVFQGQTLQETFL